MTPQELKLLDELFDRLASLESAPRDPDAVRAINEGLQRAPNALYPLVQTVLVQDEALKQADARIRALEAELDGGQPQQQQGGFLDNMRDTLMGKREQEQRGSVPSVRAGAAPSATPSATPGTPQSPWRNTTGMQGGYPQREPAYAAAPQQAPAAGAGGSFLGTAAATAAGVVGGALLANSMRGMFGGGQGQGQSHSAFDSAASGGGSPWGGNVSGSGLARDAGVNDIGGSGRTAAYDDRGGSDRAGLFDTAQNDAGDDADFDDGGHDDGGDDGSSEA